MLKKLISASLAALLLWSAVNSGLITAERTSSTELRVEIVGTAFIMELDRIGDFCSNVLSGMDIWTSALPGFVEKAAVSAKELIGGVFEMLTDDGYTPSCSIC